MRVLQHDEIPIRVGASESAKVCAVSKDGI